MAPQNQTSNQTFQVMKNVQNDPSNVEKNIALDAENNDENMNSSPQKRDEQTAFGSMPNPEVVHQSTVLERAQKMGLYTEADTENPEELDLAEEIEENEQQRKKK